jgi:cytochrome c biogenesis protein
MADEIQIPKKRDILDTLWRFFSSFRLTFSLLVLMAIALSLGKILPQATGRTIAEPNAYASWLASVESRYGGLTSLLDALGLFYITSSFWFKLLLATLAFNVIISEAERLIPLLYSIYRPEIRQPESFFATAIHHASFTTSKGLKQTVDKVRALLFRKTIVEEGPSAIYIYSERLRFAELGIPLAHIGLIILLIGAILSSRLGWREEGIALGKGQAYEVGHNTGLALRLDDFEVEVLPDGTPLEFHSLVTILKNGREVKRGSIFPNRPLSYEGVTFYQSSYGPSLMVSGMDEIGELLLLQPFGEVEAKEEVSLLFSEERNERSFAVPAQNLFIRFVFFPSLPEQGIAGPSFLVEAYKGGVVEPITRGFVRESGHFDIDGARYEIKFDHYSILRLVKDPGSIFVAFGLLLMVVGFILSFCLPSLRIWAMVAEEEGKVIVNLAGEAALIGSPLWFSRLAEEVERECS